MISVSYTHLIRREVEVCVAVGSSRLIINSGAKSERFVKKEYPGLPAQAFVHYGNFIGETLKIAATVSYTHLDVYKRRAWELTPKDMEIEIIRLKRVKCRNKKA